MQKESVIHVVKNLRIRNNMMNNKIFIEELEKELEAKKKIVSDWDSGDSESQHDGWWIAIGWCEALEFMIKQFKNK